MLRLLADENFPAVAAEALRARGHDVRCVRTDARGISDEAVLRLAKSEDRLLLTFDKDFGELVFRAGHFASNGIVLFRIVPRSAQHIAEVAVRVLESRTDWAGHFAVIEETRIRITKLPTIGAP